MRGMIEIGKIGKLIYADPADGDTIAPTTADQIEAGLIEPDHTVTIHADLSCGHVGHRRKLDIIMAVTAIHPQVASVKLMAIRHRLCWLESHLAVLGRAVIGEKGSYSYSY